MFFLESPTNPTLEVIDIAGVAKLANQIGAKVVVDNVFATPLFQKPLELGAHIVVYSATKHIDGQGRCLGGVVLSDKEWIDENLHDYFRHTGPAMSPFNAWTLLKGIETLPLRVRQQTENAAKIADFLAEQQQGRQGDLSRPQGPSAGRHHRPADEGRLDARLLRAEGRQGRGLRAAERARRRDDLQQSRRLPRA